MSFLSFLVSFIPLFFLIISFFFSNIKFNHRLIYMCPAFSLSGLIRYNFFWLFYKTFLFLTSFSKPRSSFTFPSSRFPLSLRSAISFHLLLFLFLLILPVLLHLSIVISSSFLLFHSIPRLLSTFPLPTSLHSSSTSCSQFSSFVIYFCSYPPLLYSPFSPLSNYFSFSFFPFFSLLLLLLQLLFFISVLLFGPVGLGCGIHRRHLCGGVRLLQRVSKIWH